MICPCTIPSASPGWNHHPTQLQQVPHALLGPRSRVPSPQRKGWQEPCEQRRVPLLWRCAAEQEAWLSPTARTSSSASSSRHQARRQLPTVLLWGNPVHRGGALFPAGSEHAASPCYPTAPRKPPARGACAPTAHQSDGAEGCSEDGVELSAGFAWEKWGCWTLSEPSGTLWGALSPRSSADSGVNRGSPPLWRQSGDEAECGEQLGRDLSPHCELMGNLGLKPGFENRGHLSSPPPGQEGGDGGGVEQTPYSSATLLLRLPPAPACPACE